MKRYIVILLLFLLIGCGAKVDYNMYVNTDENNIRLNIEMTVEEADYEHIQGGKEKLLDIINQSKPEEMEFALDTTNTNKYLFTMNFNDYKEYQRVYKEITGIESTSIFEDIEKSNKSPFKSYEKIEIEDDLSLLLVWLENELVNTSAVSTENKDRMISSDNFKYQFNEEEISSYQTSFYEENIVNIENVNIDVVIKKQDLLDLELSFWVLKDDTKDLLKNLKSYLKTKKVEFKIDSEDVEEGSKKYIQYKIQVDDLKLLDGNAQNMMNKLFGEGFAYITYQDEKNDSMWKLKNNQATYIQFNSSELFGLGLSLPTQVSVDISGISLDRNADKKMKVPYQSDVLEEESFQITIHTTYEQYKILNFGMLVILSGVLIFLMIKYKPRNIVRYIKGKIVIGYHCMKSIVFKYCFEDNIIIKNHCMEGNDFIINNKSIVKANLEHTWRRGLISACLLVWIAVIVLFNLDSIGFSVITFIVALLLSVINYIVYSVLTINLELNSGKNYYFSFENDGKTKEIYETLIDKVELDTVFYKEGKGTENE